MSEYNPTGLRAAAANLQQTAQTLTAALPPAAPTVPPASDPISVAAAASVDAQSAAMRASILGAIAETLAAASVYTPPPTGSTPKRPPTPPASA